MVDSSPATTDLRAGTAALVGWTNVGKSSLLNRLVGEKLAAVANFAQTTRHSIIGVRTLADRGQIVFVDTPGLHRPRHALNRGMVRRTRGSLREVDLAVVVLDASTGIGRGDVEAIRAVGDRSRLAVLNKVDLLRPRSELLPRMQRLAELGFDEVVPVSAKTGEGTDLLIDRILARLPPGRAPFPDDYLTDQTERELAAEWIREELLRHVRQELPHATAVAVRSWQVREDGLVEIDADIFVERESQRPIVVGRGGAVLKQVGQAARLELERMLEQRVYLRLWVRVREAWRDDDRVLGELGLR